MTEDSAIFANEFDKITCNGQWLIYSKVNSQDKIMFYDYDLLTALKIGKKHIL